MGVSFCWYASCCACLGVCGMHGDSQVEGGRMMPGESAARYRSRCKDG